VVAVDQVNCAVDAQAVRLLPVRNGWLRASPCSSAAAFSWIVGNASSPNALD
jgi:hypothetical protein